MKNEMLRARMSEPNVSTIIIELKHNSFEDTEVCQRRSLFN